MNDTLKYIVVSTLAFLTFAVFVVPVYSSVPDLGAAPSAVCDNGEHTGNPHCASPSPTVSPSPTGSSTPIASPTATPIASPTATPIASPTATPIASPTATPIGSVAPSASPSPTGNSLSDGRSDGRTDSLGCQKASDNCGGVGGGTVGNLTLPATGGAPSLWFLLIPTLAATLGAWMVLSSYKKETSSENPTQ